MENLLLLDDELTTTWARIVVKELRATARYRVTTVSMPREFLDLVAADRPAVAIVDWELHGVAPGGADDDSVSGETGIDVVASMLAEYANIPVVFCTKYKSVHPGEMLDPRAVFTVLQKPVRLGETAEWVRTVLVPALEEVETQFGDRSGSPLGFPLDGEATQTVFRMAPEEFGRQPDDVVRQLRYRVYGELKTYLRPLFQDSDAIWVALARLGDRIRVVNWSDHNDEPPPSLDEVRRLEHKTGSPTIVVSRPPRVEMVEVAAGRGDTPGAWIDCSYSGVDGDAFPSITLELRGRRLDLHFDTGSSHSFLSFKRAEELGVVKQVYRDYSWTVSDMAARGEVSMYEWTDFRAEFSCPSGRASVDVSAVFQMVYDWSTTPISVVCPDGRCPATIDSEGAQICGRRRLGLMGRDFLRRNAHVVLVLDGEDGITRLIPKDSEGLFKGDL